VVEIVDVPTPEPKAGEVRIRVHATTVASGDWRLRSGKVPRGFGVFIRLFFGFRGLRQPILGTELSGVIDAVGSGVTTFNVGDPVIAFPGQKMRAHAEYCVIRADRAIIPKPDALSFAEGAALSFGGTTALFFLREKAKVAPGDRVLVIGAAGCVGSAAVQLARHFGATVTAVCSAKNAELVRGLGATDVIDYGTDDFAASGKQWDVIFDAIGAAPFAHARPALAPGGRFVIVAGTLPEALRTMLPRRHGHKALGGVAPERRSDLEELAALAVQGAWRPVIDSVLPFERIVEAHARVESGHKRGSLVLELHRA